MHERATTPTHAPSSVSSVGRYRRVIRASLDRVWENVLDWEHLPWLHSETFEAIAPLSVGASGWRASVVLEGGGDAEIEVILDRPRLRYLTRTLAGAGAGSEIETLLTPSGELATGIEVDFRVPGVGRAEKEAVFGFYRALYTRLWDEDEGMMRTRETALVTRRDARETRPRLRRVVLDGVEVVFAAECPHRGGPLDDAAIEDGCVTCPWHGYRFDVRSGRCVSGQPLRLRVGAVA